eukprot:7033975-Ditylum_brightwellii.AAC.1
MTAFVEGIEDPDFKTVKQLLENHLLEIDHGDRTLDRGLNRVAHQDMEVKSQKLKVKGNGGHPKSDPDLRTASQIPNALFGSCSSEQKKAFLCWKNATVK